MPVHGQHKVADIPPHRRAPQIRRLAQRSAQLYKVAVVLIAQHELPREHGYHQLRPLAAPVVEGAQLTRQAQLFALCRLQQRKLLRPHHDVQRVRVAGKALHLQREDIKLLPPAGMGISGPAGHDAAELHVIIRGYHVHYVAVLFL